MVALLLEAEVTLQRGCWKDAEGVKLSNMVSTDHEKG